MQEGGDASEGGGGEGERGAGRDGEREASSRGGAQEGVRGKGWRRGAHADRHRDVAIGTRVRGGQGVDAGGSKRGDGGGFERIPRRNGALGRNHRAGGERDGENARGETRDRA